jgi:hypothetical protein
VIVVHEPKDPNDTDDFTLDWTLILQSGETISVLAVTSSDVTVASSAISGAQTVARLSGGTVGSTADVLYRITTSLSRQLDETLRLRIEAL